jgi:hypothetical protein
LSGFCGGGKTLDATSIATIPSLAGSVGTMTPKSRRSSSQLSNKSPSEVLLAYATSAPTMRHQGNAELNGEVGFRSHHGEMNFTRRQMVRAVSAIRRSNPSRVASGTCISDHRVVMRLRTPVDRVSRVSFGSFSM